MTPTKRIVLCGRASPPKIAKCPKYSCHGVSGPASGGSASSSISVRMSTASRSAPTQRQSTVYKPPERVLRRRHGDRALTDRTGGVSAGLGRRRGERAAARQEAVAGREDRRDHLGGPRCGDQLHGDPAGPGAEPIDGLFRLGVVEGCGQRRHQSQADLVESPREARVDLRRDVSRGLSGGQRRERVPLLVDVEVDLDRLRAGGEEGHHLLTGIRGQHDRRVVLLGFGALDRMDSVMRLTSALQ